MSGTFEDLSQDLSLDERRDLLGRVQSSLNLNAKDTDSIVSKADGPDELRLRLLKEVPKLGFLDRLVLKLAAFLTNRSEQEVLGERKLAPSRLALREKVPALVNFGRQEWTADFAKAIYDLYAEVVPVKPLFDHLFQQKLTLQAGLLVLIREEHPAAVRGLEDLFPDRELAAQYRGDQRRSALVAELDRRLQDYLDTLPAGVLDRVRDKMRLLYFLRPVVQYPYGFLFELFGHNPEKFELVKYPFFNPSPWRKPAALLERLYYGLYLAAKLEWREGALNALLGGTLDRLPEEKAPLTLDGLNRRLASVLRTAQDLGQRVPWKDVLLWSFQDPYYQVKYILPSFSVSDFYQTTLKMTCREDLEARLPGVRRQVLAEESEALFEGGVAHPLEYYVEGAVPSSAASKVRGFRSPQTLALLWTFLNGHFVKKVHPFQQSLIRMVAPSGRSALQTLNNAVDELIALRSRIHAFDRSLHPDSGEGKDFQKLKYELASKALSLKPFLQLVETKDSQARDLITRGIDTLQTLAQHLAGVKDRNVPALKAVLNLPYLLDGQPETIENGLDRVQALVSRALFVLRESLSLE